MSLLVCYSADTAEDKNMYPLFIQVGKQFEATLFISMYKQQQKNFCRFSMLKNAFCVNHE